MPLDETTQNALGVTLGERIIEALLAVAMLSLLFIAAYASVTRPHECISVERITLVQGVARAPRSLELDLRNTCNAPIRVESVSLVSMRDGIVSYMSVGRELGPGDAVRVGLPLPNSISHTEVHIVYTVNGEVHEKTAWVG